MTQLMKDLSYIYPMRKIPEWAVSGGSDLLSGSRASTVGLLNLTWNDQANVTCRFSEVNACRRHVLIDCGSAVPTGFHREVYSSSLASSNTGNVVNDVET